MSNFLYIAKQPIYGKDEHIFGYELYYRQDDQEMTLPDKRLATASVLVNILNQMGLHTLVGSAKAFINIDAKILLTDIIYTIPKDRFVLELNEDIQINQKEYECVKALHDEGYSFALDNVSFDEDHIRNITKILPHVDYVKFDTINSDFELLKEKVSMFDGKKLMAQKIESIFVLSAYKELGFDFFQGYHLAKPELIKKNRIDPHHLGVIRLFNLLQGSVSMHEICTEFEQHNEIVLQLLQFVNSGGFNFETTPKSICDVLEFIGKKPLMQWLMLIVYAKSGRTGDEDLNPSSILVQNRIDLMLGILRRMKKDDEELIMQARFVALLSLLETVFEMPLPIILAQLDVEDVIKHAILDKEGDLGKLYALVLALETSDQEKSERLLLAYGLEIESTWHILEEHLGHPGKIVH
ncbi:EAL domain-containing protein [Sulfurimonas sp. MAG313]|nr:EAL domain-containing protein [Sulfurimonas sp. MAG313]MDF1881716.1 EAL domain-containing protein [Sulfurimonas sp. MAG313]